MKEIILFDIKTKKEFDKFFRRFEQKWEKETKKIQKILRNGF